MFLLLHPVLAVVPSHDPNRLRRIQVVVDNPGPQLEDFQVLVELGPQQINLTQGSGADGRFFVGSTPVDFEIERWTTTGATLWVRVPLLEPGENTLWYYDIASQPDNLGGPDPLATWAGTLAVWHMEGLESSTAVTSTPLGSPAVQAGQIGGARAFDGTERIDVGNEPLFDTTDLTVSLWVRRGSWASVGNAYIAAISKGLASWRIRRPGDSERIGFAVTTGPDPGTYVPVHDITLPIDTWMHLTGVVRGLQAELWVDGVVAQAVTLPAPLTQSNANVAVGGHDPVDPSERRWVGDLDEVRVEGIARSPEWIWATQLNETRQWASVCGIQDEDADGAPCVEDCADDDASRHPQAVDVPDDGIDQDCDGVDATEVIDTGAADTGAADADTDTDTDADTDAEADTDPGEDLDGDGVAAPLDCDDNDPEVSPLAIEDVGGRDLDCDGDINPLVDVRACACGTSVGSTWAWGWAFRRIRR